MRKTIVCILLLAALVLCACAEATTDPTTAPTEATNPMPAGYVLVSTATQSGWLPLPTEGESVFPLAQVLPDGTQSLNLIHLTPEGVYMEDSTCKNHDCVDEGMVTIENIPERVLGNMIVCLPNQVVLQLYTPEETMAILGELPVLNAEE